MSEPFLAEIRMVGFNFAPRGWALCDGQILPINQNQALYSLLGAMYGGDGRTSFALPDLRGRTPMHAGVGFDQGDKGGEATHALTANEMPNHDHVVQGSNNDALTPIPTGNVLASPPTADVYVPQSAGTVDMSAASVTSAGGGQAHENMQPFTVVNFMIAIQGLFPSRN